mgnify:CR=1 FL=1
MFVWSFVQTSVQSPGRIPEQLKVEQFDNIQFYILNMKYKHKDRLYKDQRRAELFQILSQRVQYKKSKESKAPRYCRICKAYKVTICLFY